MVTGKKTVAVFFGGRSPEHDVSVVSGLQALQAIDSTRYDAFPVYVAPDGRWLTGAPLRERANYIPGPAALKTCHEVTLDVRPTGRGALLPRKAGFFGGKPAGFDVALLAFHGLYGEDGAIQGLFELAGVAYTGMRVMATSLFMDKAASKYLMQSLGIPCLPFAVLRRPAEGYYIAPQAVQSAIGNIGFPCIVKPSHLGSSIGVAKAKSAEEISAVLPAVFEYDDTAIIEPFVPNLVEYNVSVSGAFGSVRTSAIERPKTSAELLDFKEKYMSGGGTKGGTKGGGTKSPGSISQGMLSLTREINPALPPETEAHIRDWAIRLFSAAGGTGAPRIDFLGDAKTGEIWMNEINPIPGSLAYFLWEAAAEPVLFTPFLTGLIEEALRARDARVLPADPVPVGARLFKRA